MNSKTSSLAPTDSFRLEYRAVKKQRGFEVWYELEYRFEGRMWTGEYGRYKTEFEVREAVRRRNIPDEPIITTVLS